MTKLEDPTKIEAIVGAKRHHTDHIGRAVSAEQQVYILHSVECVERITAAGSDLRQCAFSRALDNGLDKNIWEWFEDLPVVLAISDKWGDLEPVRAVSP